MDYAHSRGVIHRDLKPANIILGKHGETLVVDWGLAKVVGRPDPSVGEQTIAPSSSGSSETLPGSALGTPAYMSPEQAAGDLERLGPLSDVYSLGATLYCLLTGKPPDEGDDVGELLRRVQRGEFPSPRQRDASIDRALEGVCLKAMAHRPMDRYSSPKALADDIERWMADEPVSAWREPLARRVRRWASRNRTAVASVAMLMATAIVALALGAVLINRERSKAEANFRQARAAVDDYLTTVSENTLLRSPAPGLQPLRRRLLEACCGTTRTSRFGTAKTRPCSRPGGRDRAGRRDHRRDRVAGRGDRGLGRAAGLYEELARPDRTGRAYTAERGRCLARMGKLESDSGRNDEAIAHFRRAIALLEPTAAWRDGATTVRADLAFAHHYLARMLASARGASEEGERHLRRAIELREALAAENPDDPAYGTELSTSLSNLGDLQNRSGRTTEALASVRRALALQQDLAGLARRPAAQAPALAHDPRGGDHPEYARPKGGERAALPSILGPHRAGRGRQSRSDRVSARAGDHISRAGPVLGRSKCT